MLNRAAEGWEALDDCVMPFIHAVCRIGEKHIVTTCDGSTTRMNSDSNRNAFDSDSPSEIRPCPLGSSFPRSSFSSSFFHGSRVEKKRSKLQKGGKGSGILIALPEKCSPLPYHRQEGNETTYGVRGKTKESEEGVRCEKVISPLSPYNESGRYASGFPLRSGDEAASHSHFPSSLGSSHVDGVPKRERSHHTFSSRDNSSSYRSSNRGSSSSSGGGVEESRKHKKVEESSTRPMGLLLTTSFVLPDPDVAARSAATFLENPVAGTTVHFKREPHSFTVGIRPDKQFVTSIKPQEESSKAPFVERSKKRPEKNSMDDTSNAIHSPTDSMEAKGSTSLDYTATKPSCEYPGFFNEEEEEEEEEEIGYTVSFINVDPLPFVPEPLSSSVLFSSSLSSPLRTCFPLGEKGRCKPLSSLFSQRKSKETSLKSVRPPSLPRCSPSVLSPLEIDGLHLIQPLPLPLLLSHLPPIQVGDCHLIVTHINGARRAYVPLRVAAVYDDYCQYESDALMKDFSSGGAAFDRYGNFVGLQHQRGDSCISLLTSSIVRQLFQSDLLGMCQSPISDLPLVALRSGPTISNKNRADMFNEPFHILQSKYVMDVGDKGNELANFSDIERVRSMAQRVSGVAYFSNSFGAEKKEEIETPKKSYYKGELVKNNPLSPRRLPPHYVQPFRMDSAPDVWVHGYSQHNRHSAAVMANAPSFEAVYNEFFTPFGSASLGFSSRSSGGIISSRFSCTCGNSGNEDGAKGMPSFISFNAPGTLSSSFQSLIHLLFAFWYNSPLMQRVLKELTEKKYAPLRPHMATSGGIGAILEILDGHREDHELVENCLGCLALLCLDVGNLAVFIQLNGVVSVTEVLQFYLHDSKVLQWGIRCIMSATNTQETPQARESIDIFLRYDGFEVVTYALNRHGPKNHSLVGWIGVLLDHLLDTKEAYGYLVLMLQKGLPVKVVTFLSENYQTEVVLSGLLPFLAHLIVKIRQYYKDKFVNQWEGRECKEAKVKQMGGDSLSPPSSSASFLPFPLFSRPGSLQKPTDGASLILNEDRAGIRGEEEKLPRIGSGAAVIDTVRYETGESKVKFQRVEKLEKKDENSSATLPFKDLSRGTGGKREQVDDPEMESVNRDDVPTHRNQDGREKATLCHPFCGMPCIFVDFLSSTIQQESFMNLLGNISLFQSMAVRLPRSPELLHCVVDILEVRLLFEMPLSSSSTSVFEEVLAQVKRHLPTELELADRFRRFLDLQYQFIP